MVDDVNIMVDHAMILLLCRYVSHKFLAKLYVDEVAVHPDDGNG